MGIILLAILKVIGWCSALMPGPLRMFVGGLLGRLLSLIGYRREVMRKNLERAFPGEDIKCLMRESYRHFGVLLVEMPIVFSALPYFIRNKVMMKGFDNWVQANKAGKGVIILGSHIANWEFMSAAGAMAGIEGLILVTKHLKPEWLHQAFEKGRATAGVGATYEPRTMKDVLKNLRSGRSVGIVLDQYAGPPVSVRVPFFGVPVGTANLVAMLTKRTGAPVMPVNCYRERNGQIVVEAQEIVDFIEDDDPHVELALNTAQYTQIIERNIREHPTQWTWTHRRFKGDLSPLKPDEWSAARVRN